MARTARFEAQTERLDDLLPHLGGDVASDFGDELLEANNHDLDDLTTLCLADKQHEDVGVDRHNEAQGLQVPAQEIIETLDNLLDCL